MQKIFDNFLILIEPVDLKIGVITKTPSDLLAIIELEDDEDCKLIGLLHKRQLGFYKKEELKHGWKIYLISKKLPKEGDNLLFFDKGEKYNIPCEDFFLSGCNQRSETLYTKLYSLGGDLREIPLLNTAVLAYREEELSPSDINKILLADLDKSNVLVEVDWDFETRSFKAKRDENGFLYLNFKENE